MNVLLERDENQQVEAWKQGGIQNLNVTGSSDLVPQRLRSQSPFTSCLLESICNGKFCVSLSADSVAGAFDHKMNIHYMFGFNGVFSEDIYVSMERKKRVGFAFVCLLDLYCELHI